MKTKDKKELFTKSVLELKKLLEEAVKAVSSFKLDHQQNKLKDTRSIFNKRKEVAILKSILNMKSVMEKAKEVEKEVKEEIKKVEKKVKTSKGGKK